MVTVASWRTTSSHGWVHHLKGIRRSGRKKTKNLEGLRSVYCVSSTSQEGVVEFCKVTCYCAGCVAEDFEACTASEAFGEWKTHEF